MFRKRKNNNRLFPLQYEEDFDIAPREQDETFLEEAFGAHESAQRPTSTFVGSVISKRRFHIGLAILVGVFLIFIGRVSALQIFNGTEYRMQAENNRFRINIIPAQRGVIYDRDGMVLAKNEPVFQLIATPAQFSKDDPDYIYRVSELFGLDEAAIREAIENQENPRDPILIAENLPHDRAILFASSSANYPGISMEISSRRNYITYAIPTLSHVIGYTGIVNAQEYEMNKSKGYRRFDHIGKQGIELFYEATLRGTFGREVLEVDALGRTERIVSKTDPVNGENITLSIDASFQTYVEEVLEARLSGTVARRASVVIMDPENGEILSLVSWPAYDANVFTGRIDPDEYRALIENPDLPLFPRAYAGEFPSGSTIKPVYAAAGLIEGVITPTTAVLSNGGIAVGPWFFPDWRPGGHGMTNVYHAIADSVNTFFYILGGGYQNTAGIGVEKLMEYASLFGFGETSEIDLFGEADGFLPSREWKERVKGERWYIGDTYNVSIGQGDFLVTPLQIARATAVFANRGHLVRPKLNMATEVKREQIISENIANIVRDGMRRTVTTGSAPSMQSVPVPVAGKTGTAQWSSIGKNHSWFTGFAPFDQPKIVITVLVEEGGDDALAIPIAREILTRWFADSP